MRRRLPALLASALLIAACGESQQPEPPANSKTGGAQANAQGLDELGVEPAGDAAALVLVGLTWCPQVTRRRTHQKQNPDRANANAA